MPNLPTPPSITITGDWVDLYAASGIPVGTQLLVTCRGKLSAYLAESATQPSADLDGIEIYPTRQYVIDVESPGLWARMARASVDGALVVQVDNVV